MATEGKQSFVRRDALQQLELDMQKKWEDMKVFEIDAPDEDCEKFMVTFPYPYMNGLLHIGHAYSLTKADFAAHFNRLLGKKVLFPFGFHCTGMPIQAAANKLKREYEVYGKPHPTFPAGRPQPVEADDGTIRITDDKVTLKWKKPACTGNKNIKVYRVFMKVGKGEFSEVATLAPEQVQGKTALADVPIESGGCVYKIITELEDGSQCPESKESDEVSVDAPAPAKDKKGGGAPGGKRVAKKILAKTGDAAFQWEIMASMGNTPEDTLAFEQPEFWLEHYPPLGIRDLKRFGCPVDFRRSFITTSINPYYDSFIRWQFGKLRKGEKIGFGKRPTIFSELDGQACMDHDRAEGEGVAPQEYTAIKIELLELPPAMKSLEGKKVFLLAATLRPETMPGQTNCWILPEGNYGCYDAQDKSVYVCSQRAARNMSFQDILMPWGNPKCLLEVTGKDLMGLKVKAPTAKYASVYTLPLLTIKMDKGTGIVTSVPSDSPDDYAAFMDLMKPGKREHFGIKAEWVEPFELVPIIDVEIDGELQTLAAKYMCEKLGVQSQKDKEKLLEAHDVCYKLGFDKGIMSAGPFKGQPVKKAKLEFRAQMISDKQAFLYSEPEKKVVSRSGDECVVAGIDQWYLKYGEESWRTPIEEHLNSPNFCAYNERIKESFAQAFDWLKEWACSRSFGLGTKVPWDEQFVIESLSDSTIYMAYYCVAHMLQGGVLNGSGESPEGIKPEDLTDDVWDFVFLNGPAPKKSKIQKKTLEKMRKEFRFWYPLDLRVSGKDLIKNHLTMALYNHAAVWDKEPDMWPRGFFCNGWLLVNGEKMSKSKGNFFTIVDIIQKYTADTVRLACASSGDTLEDANFDEEVAKNTLLDMYVFLENMRTIVQGNDPMEEVASQRFVDLWFSNELNRLVMESKRFYEVMLYRESLRTAYYGFMGTYKKYRDICGQLKILPNKSLTMRYLEWQLIVISPICPHFSEYGWGLLGKKGTVLDARYPSPTADVDKTIASQGDYIFEDVPHSFIKLKEKASKKEKPTVATVYVATAFPDWKVKVLEVLRQKNAEGKLPLCSPDDVKKLDGPKGEWKAIIQDLMSDASLKPFAKYVGSFAAFKRDEAATTSTSALESTVPFDEVALLKEHISLLKQKLDLTDISVSLATELQAPEHENSASIAQPGAPSMHFHTSGSSGAAGGGKAAGGKAPTQKASGGVNGKSASKDITPPSNFAAITDMKKFNEHMSTRSYVEGGPSPTAGDVSQLASVPHNVSEDEYPHVARWYRHISFFSADQRANW